MYTKPEFAPPSRDAVFDLIDALTFATMVTVAPDGASIVASHLTFLVERDRGANGTLVSHLARDNEHAALVEAGRPSAVIFSGPHGYISSSWYPGYPSRDSAPTWNFAVVHCHGKPEPLREAALARHLHQLAVHLERGRPKPWRMGELGPGGMERRMPRILGFELPIERLEAKFKMGQDERRPDTAAAIEVLEEAQDPLAPLMRSLNSDLFPPRG